jgi:hypothetical protein
MDSIAFAAVNTAAAAFLELPMPVMKTAMLFNIPTFLFMEHRDVFACVRDGLQLPNSAAADLHVKLVRILMSVHPLTAPLLHPRFLSRGLLLIAVLALTVVVSQLLLNGHKVLSRHTASTISDHRDQTMCARGRRISTMQANATRTGVGLKPWAWVDDWASWTQQSSLLRALNRPLANSLSDADLDAELVFMRTALSMRITNFMVPILCTPVVMCSYVM